MNTDGGESHFFTSDVHLHESLSAGPPSGELLQEKPYLVAAIREQAGLPPRSRILAKGGYEHASVFFVLSDAVDGFVEIVADFVAEAIFHQESVFAAVLIKAAQDANGLETSPDGGRRAGRRGWSSPPQE